jgi:hypothetical protein
MVNDNRVDIRAEVVRLLLEIVENDRYPSTAMLRMIEELANDEEREVYAQILMDNVRSSTYPSIPMLRRLVSLP